MDKEIQNSMYPEEIISMSFRFSGKALQWLHGTTKDDGGKETSNFTLFDDLLSGWHLQPERVTVSKDRSCFPPVRRSIPRNSSPLGGTWAGNVYATCWPHSQNWG